MWKSYVDNLVKTGQNSTCVIFYIVYIVRVVEYWYLIDSCVTQSL